MTNVVTFHNVSLGYDNELAVLKRLNLTIKGGSFHYLTGASGAGKSLMIKAIHAQIRPLEGQLTVLNHRIELMQAHDIPVLRQRIGVVFQDFKLIDTISLIENMALPLHIQGMSRRDALQCAYETLGWLDFKPPFDIMPSALSGGQKQRLSIGRAIITSPQLLLADEATGNLDDINAVRILKMCKRLNKAGMTIIFVTHNYGLIRMFPYPIIHIDGDTAVQLPALTQVNSDTSDYYAI